MIFKMPPPVLSENDNSLLSMTYVSQLLWHFVRDKKSPDGEVIKTSFEILNEGILLEGGRGNLKRYPNPSALPPWNEYYVRKVVLGTSIETITNLKATAIELEKTTLVSVKEHEEYLEPRAVCFADIPFNFLPIHMERYSGIGLGFRRRLLSDSYEDLRPVAYIPRLTQKSIGQHIADEASKVLKTYVKVESINNKKEGMDGEPFELIYREREWRRPADIEFNASSLACIVFRTAKELEQAHQSNKFKSLLASKVAFLNMEDFFERPNHTLGESE